MSMNLKEAEIIPGMIEPVERELLYTLARSLSLQPGDSIVEFGALFGRSTNCLAQGLTANTTRTSDNLIHAYDSFRCAADGLLSPHVRGMAEQAGLTDLLRREGPDIDFRPVFEQCLKKYIDLGVVRPVPRELADSDPPPGTIALMHIDAPKFYDEFKIVAFRFLPQTKIGSVLVFQDFFYHWSATLIAAVAVMITRGLLTAERSAASSLVTRVTKIPTLEELVEVDLMLGDKREIPLLIQEAIQIARAVPLDRADMFLPRLYLAKFQYLWEGGNFAEAADEVGQFFNSGNTLNQSVVTDFMEMMAKGFSIRRLYEQDHV